MNSSRFKSIPVDSNELQFKQIKVNSNEFQLIQMNDSRFNQIRVDLHDCPVD